MDKKVTFKLILFAIGVILVFMINNSATNYTNDLAKDDFKTFNSTNINGTLTAIGIKHHTTSFKVNNDSREFVFYPRRHSSELGRFSSFAEIGDRIVKPALANTLILIKGQRTYKYAFDKDE